MDRPRRRAAPIETQRDFLTGRGLDPGPAGDVDADPAAAWRTPADAVGTLLARSEVPDTAYDGYFGPTTLGERMGRRAW